MKNITKTLILLSIPDQILIIYALIVHGGPICYLLPFFEPPSDPELLYGGPASMVFQCRWGNPAALEPLLFYSLIITLPMMLVVFLIYCVKNRRRRNE